MRLLWLLSIHCFLGYFLNSIKYITFIKLKKLIKSKRKYLNSSRSYRYFGIDLDYEDYLSQVKSILNDFNPTIVLGECTQFYEILFIDECIKRNIIYLAPMPTRYPRGRFEFLLYDTDYPLTKKSNIVRSDKTFYKEARILMNSIVNNSVLPNSIITNRSDSKGPLFFRLKIISAYYIKILTTSLFIENAITPRLDVKIIKILKTKLLNRKISKRTLSSIDSLSPFFLYPMQLQPENNIDIHGIKFSNQAKLINQLGKFLEPYKIDLYVKPNPVPKYQIDDNLIKTLNSSKNVYYLDDNIKMKTLLDRCLAVCSVTGTVLLEAAARNINVFSFASTRLSKTLGFPILNKVSDLTLFMTKLNDTKNYSDGVLKYLRDVYQSSYEGHIYDPVRENNMINNEENIKKLSNAFNDIINYDFSAEVDLSLIRAGKNIRFSDNI